MKLPQPIIASTMFSHHKYHTAAPPAAASGVPVKPIWHFTLSLGTHSLTVAGPTDRPTDGRTDGRLYSPRIDTSFASCASATRRRILEMRPPSLSSSLRAAAYLGKSPLTLLRNFRLLPSFLRARASGSSFLLLKVISCAHYWMELKRILTVVSETFLANFLCQQSAFMAILRGS